MSTTGRMIGRLIRISTRRRARRVDLPGVIERLEASREVVEERMTRAADSAANREAINHIIGIERWGRDRLARAGRGEQYEMDSYRDYRLPDSAGLAELRSAFASTRAETLRFARDLSADDAQRTVRHNDLGELTVVEWFVYLDDHAKRESLRIRRA